ncbi:hypothetical protein DL98DRAFT_517151 [Cadophora sp. DSE1049]|nr:hypothetical protein DL98DRAFT_517151 [Cadophora sp. DSE1049]
MMAAAQVLVDALATLKNPDGTLQEGNRKLALGTLISQLTESEIIDVRLRLNARRKQGFPEKLPAELHHKILDYLSLEDSMNMRLVRLNWSRNFSSVQFCAEIVKRHFTEKHELYTEEVGGPDNVDEDKLAAGKNLKEWLENVIKYRLRRARGEYESMSVYYYSEKPAEENWGSPQYCNGRIAYLGLDRVLMVKNVCGESSQRFPLPQRETPKQWLLSDEYIVAVSTNQRTVYAWQLGSSFADSQNDPHNQHLPNAIAKLTARDNRIGIVLRNGEVYIWEIGRPKNPLSTVPLPWTKLNLDRLERREVLVMLHPYKRDTFCICSHIRYSISRHSQRGIHRSQFQFYEYEDFKAKSRHTAYLNSRKSKKLRPPPQINALQDTFVGVLNLSGFLKLVPKRESDAYDDLHADEDNIYAQDTLVEFAPEDTGSKGSLFQSETAIFTFDMETKQFQCHNYYEPSHNIRPIRMEPETEFLIWRSQTLCPVYRSDLAAESPPEGITDLLATAVHHTPSPNRPASEVYWYREDQDGHTTVHRSAPSDKSRKQMTAFHWIGRPDFARAARFQVKNDPNSQHDLWYPSSEVIPPRRVKGDDRFVVLFGTKGYVVWCFDPEVRLGLKDSEKDPNAPRYLKIFDS